MSLAIIFPGQGSQQIGMMQDVYGHYPVVADIFNEASEALGFDVYNLIQDGPLEKLNETKYTQVAMLTADVAIFRILEKYNLPIDFMAGHSLGEYAALVAAKSLDFVEAVKLVHKRGELMQQTVAPEVGKMAAIIGLDDNVVVDICHKASNESTIVTPANFNSIGQIVIAGHTEAVLRAIEIAEEKGARMAKVIPVGAPCHCGLLKDAADLFQNYLNEVDFKVPQCNVISNVDLTVYNNADEIKKLLKLQLYNPVLWVQTINFMKQQGVGEIIECGPGKVLNGLVKRIDKTLKIHSLNSVEAIENYAMELMNV